MHFSERHVLKYFRFLGHMSRWPIAQATYFENAYIVVRRLSSVKLFTFSSFFSRTARLSLMKLGNDEVLIFLTIVIVVRSESPRGGSRMGQKQVTGYVLHNTFSLYPSDTTKQLHSNNLEACGKKCCYFWFHSKIKFLTLFLLSFSNKLLEQGYVKERLKSSLRKFYGRYGDLIKQYEVSLSQMLNDIL